MSEKIPCTVGVLTKNSASGLERALASVNDFAEIVICDGGSTDDTLEIAKKYGARIIAQNKDFLDADGYIQNFSGVRNQTLEAASNDWYFFLDSDEYISPALVDSIRSVVGSRSEGAFNVFRRYVFKGKEVTCATSYPNRSMRFFSKRSVSGFKKIVHERPLVKPGVTPQDLRGALFVPVGGDLTGVWKRNDRYVALEVRRKGYVGIMRFFGYARGELKTNVLYLFRLARNYMFCSGVRLPLSIELARHRYTLRLLAAMWRARRAAYPPRVLFLLNKWKTGGAEHIILREMQALHAEGITVRYAPVYGDTVPPGMESRSCSFPHFRHVLDVGAYIRLLTMMGEEEITHVFATLEHAQIIARIAGFFSPRIRVVISEPGMAERKPVRYKLLDLILNMRTSAIIAVSRGVRRSLLRYQSIYGGKMEVLPNGIDVPPHLPPREEPSTFTVLAVGSLRAEKGFDILLGGFRGFIEMSNANARLVIVGKGGLQEQLQQKARALGIGNKVQFLGEIPHDEVHALYRKVSCFVLSSVSEGNPNVVLEALSQGTPVIATAVSGAEDMVENEVSGLLVQPGSPEALSDALQRLYENHDFRLKLGVNGYERAKLFSFEKHMRELRRILRI